METKERLGPILEYLDHIHGKHDQFLPNVTVFRKEETSEFEAMVYKPVICLILQGSKQTIIGEQERVLCAGDALVVSHDLPVKSKILVASKDKPYLALIIALDLNLVRRLYEKVGAHLDECLDARSLSSGPVGCDLIEPIARYLNLINNPLDAQVLGPAVLNEIHYRLLISPIGGMIRNLISVDSHASRISKAILKIRTEFRRSLTVSELAKSAGMSESSFHGHFKHVTGTTPLQYQKDLRMIEARDLLRAGQHNVSAASFEVGYESPTHFSRDYLRKFGISPSNEASLILEHA